jgi:hypothetical protein
MSATYEFITKQTLGAEAATVTFSNIPQTFTDLLIVSSARSARTVNLADNLNLRFNGDAGGNYSFRYLEGNGSAASSTSGSSAAQMIACYTPTAAATASRCSARPIAGIAHGLTHRARRCGVALGPALFGARRLSVHV